jgi:cellulose biosynthesis protein BcsQ
VDVKSLTFFNNKGGVGKTTLACNMAHYLATHLSLNVLLVDGDPQCNATQLLLEDEEWQDIYEDREASETKTILKVLSQIRMGDSGIDTDLEIHRSKRFQVDVLAGHPSLSAVEDRLSQSWTDFRAGDAGGFRRSRWVASLVDSVDYDLVIFDVGPSLGALNRSVLIGTDRFVTPMAADLFSLYSLDNISEWVSGWSRDYESAVEAVVRDNAGLPGIRDYPTKSGIESSFAGYTVQQYVSKRSGNEVRSVAAYDQFKEQIPARARQLTRFRAPDAQDPALGVVPNMFSMVPLAQSVHAPIMDLSPKDGVRGAQVSQHRAYSEQLTTIGSALARNAGLVS